MRLVTFTHDGADCIGALDQDSGTIVNFAKVDPDLPGDMLAFINLGQAGLDQAAKAVASAGDDAKVRLDDVSLKSPIPNPLRDIMAVGRNYHEHAQEFHDSGFDATSGTTAVPDDPIIFTKATTSMSGPFDPIPSYLDHTNSTDYEGELAVIIGKEGRGIKKDEAFDYVYGYSTSNDVTARTLQHQHKQWFIGKGLDGYCPMGPCILTADEAGHPDTFYLTTDVNGERRQDSSCSALIFNIPTLIETISAGITMLPGDIIVTGTPVGVGIGFKPPVFLQKGDVVRVNIEPIGAIENKVE
jgi:2-keto-4-pentenoate hydratase/2-oxohepta-3-ene-1,7-dioic acid hydratase in catechol pathway